VRDWSSLDDRSIKTFVQRKNVRLLRERLSPAEHILVVARATGPYGGSRAGLLAVTDRRIVFLRESITKEPFVFSLRFDDISTVSFSEQPFSGSVTLETVDGPAVFDRIRPKERTWPLYWRIGERIGQLPLGEHS
jgi:hypothetical protein